MYSRIGPAAYKNNLMNTIRLCEFLDNPQKDISLREIKGKSRELCHIILLRILVTYKQQRMQDMQANDLTILLIQWFGLFLIKLFNVLKDCQVVFMSNYFLREVSFISYLTL